jgi:hypothetical protein
VFLASGASLTNFSKVTGGSGGMGGASGYGYFSTGQGGQGGLGGAGVYLAGKGRLSNAGTIQGGRGGAGGYGYVYEGVGGYGGAGVVAEGAATISNLGSILGGAGGLAHGGAGVLAALNLPGDGVDLAAGGRVTNGGGADHTALIRGYDGVYAAAGAAATVTNFGTIDGTSGISVVFHAAVDRLIVEAGSSLIGTAQGGGGTVELAGGTGTLSGLGTTAILSGAASGRLNGFATYDIGGGANWTLIGPSRLDKNEKLIVLAGGTAAATGSMTNAGLIEALGSGARLTLAAVANTGTLLAATGGELIAGGAVTGTGVGQVNGGTLDVVKAFHENVAFTGSTGVLELGDSTAYNGQVSGFSKTGQTSFDLADIGFTNIHQASFSGTTSGGVLTVSDGTHTAHIHLVGDYTSLFWVTESDGHGGVSVRDTTAPPPASATALSQQMAAMGGGASAATAGSGGTQAEWMARPLLAVSR